MCSFLVATSARARRRSPRLLAPRSVSPSTSRARPLPCTSNTTAAGWC
ncbi:UNVERIFIED_CONTAM: hypothetical protein GTU68_063613 [Idotea baltica]|nr:hypothetical protein [Idotea baltica]